MSKQQHSLSESRVLSGAEWKEHYVPATAIKCNFLNSPVNSANVHCNVGEEALVIPLPGAPGTNPENSCTFQVVCGKKKKSPAPAPK